MAITLLPSATLSADGRVLLQGGGSATRSRLIVALYGDLGGGTASLQVSHHDSPSTSTDSEWATLDGASDLTAGTAYRIEISGAAIALRLTGSTTPSLTIAWS
jgi:hypothetical protein